MAVVFNWIRSSSQRIRKRIGAKGKQALLEYQQPKWGHLFGHFQGSVEPIPCISLLPLLNLKVRRFTKPRVMV
ncbi:hypothetical protein HanPSC8_Chr03g0101941 [Helianthus annuus]|nr:hypothetical protein HanPSC8_Chr03g0101941 [Helianthus annuus]